MKSRKTWMVAFALAAALTATSSSSHARQIYISPMAGYTTAGSLELGEADLDDVKVDDGFTWGGQIGFQSSPGFTFEASWMMQETQLVLKRPSAMLRRAGSGSISRSASSTETSSSRRSATEAPRILTS